MGLMQRFNSSPFGMALISGCWTLNVSVFICVFPVFVCADSQLCHFYVFYVLFM